MGTDATIYTLPNGGLGWKWTKVDIPRYCEKQKNYLPLRGLKINVIMDFTGKIIAVLPIKQGESARGPWKSQEYVLEYYEQGSQYSNKVVFNAFGENVDKFQIQEGQDYTVSVNINAREWQGRWFNDIRAWRVVQANTVAQQPTYTQAPIASAPMPEGMKTPEAFNANENAQSAESSDDLPF